MKAPLFSADGKSVRAIDLPKQFAEEYRPDLIMRAVKAIHTHDRQPYGALPTAGMRQSAKLSRRRRDFKTAYGHGISRVPRKTMWRRGTRFGWVGAFAPGTVGGRRSHPPKAHKIFDQKINDKERRKAIRSALAATANLSLVKTRGHLAEQAPLIIDSSFEKLAKTRDVEKVLHNMKLAAELMRVSQKKIRAGKGKTRNRKYKVKKGPLIVTSATCPLSKAAMNIAGVDICPVSQLNTDLLAPGGQAARLTVFTESAIQALQTKNLFCETQASKAREKQP